jgi:hypothetical protein
VPCAAVRSTFDESSPSVKIARSNGPRARPYFDFGLRCGPRCRTSPLGESLHESRPGAEVHVPLGTPSSNFWTSVLSRSSLELTSTKVSLAPARMAQPGVPSADFDA